MRSYLIAAGLASSLAADPGSKARKATEPGVRTITEAEWRDLAGLG